MGNIDSFAYGMPAMDAAETEVVGYVLVAYFAGMLLSSVYSVVIYILQSLGMFTVARRRGISKPWLAWIPVANVWTLGSISDQYRYVTKGKVCNRRKTLLGLNIAILALLIPFMVSYVAFLVTALESIGNDAEIMTVIVPMLLMLGVCIAILVVSVIQTVHMYIAYYDLFASCKPGAAVAFLVLSILFGFLLPFFVFACRKHDLGMPPRKDQIPEQPAAEAEPEPQIMEALPETTEEPTEE